MAGDWLKVETATPDKPEVFEIGELLGIDPELVFTKCFRVWCWFDQHTENGSAPVTVKPLLDRYACNTGFIDAMEKVGWLQFEAKNGRELITLPNFDRHNGKTAKRRAETNRRVAKHRQAKHDCNAESVTDVTEEKLQKALPEKRREEKSIESTEKKKECPPASKGKTCDKDKSDDTPKKQAGRQLIDLPAMIEAGNQLGIDPKFSEAFWIDCDSNEWKDRSGKKIISPVMLLQSNWNAREKNTAQSDDWEAKNDLRRIQGQIDDILKNPIYRERNNGNTLTKMEHRERFEDSWLEQVRKCRDEFKVKLPSDWKGFQSIIDKEESQRLQFKEQFGTDDYELIRLPEEFPDDVPSFERWDKEWNKGEAWVDPDALTARGNFELKNLKKMKRQIEAKGVGNGGAQTDGAKE